MIIYLPLLVAIIGLIGFILPGNADRKALCKDAWWVGLLVFLFQVGTHSISLLK